MAADLHRCKQRDAWVAILASTLTSCIASNVVAVEDRAVVRPVDAEEWGADPATVLVNGGLFESVQIEGEAAEHLIRIYYLFERTGRYTAAALSQGSTDGGATFQTLVGTWELRGQAVVLDGGDPIPLRAAAGNLLELRAPTGLVVLRRVEGV
jgi:hypothetical protein